MHLASKIYIISDMNNIQDIIAAIQCGALDVNLDTIERAVHIRRIQTRTTPQMEHPDDGHGSQLPVRFTVGMKVRFNSKTRPTYLRGQTATITKVNQVRVKVKLDIPSGRFGEGDIMVPTNLIEAA